MKKITVLTIALLMALSLCSCGSAKSQSYPYETTAAATAYAGASYAKEAAYSMDMEEMEYEQVPNVGMGNGVYGNDESAQNGTTETNDTAEADHGRKLIRNVNVNMQTLQFDALLEGIKAKVSALGGYIENSGVYNGSYQSYSMRNANITARIPQTRLEEFLNTAFEGATITNMSESTEDITLRYSDMESKVASLRTEQERLMQLMEKAESVEDLITIEQRLSEVRYEIESYQSSLKNFDNKVTYSTVWIYIDEVKNITPPVKATFGERIRTGWQKNTAELGEDIEDFFVWLITNFLEIILTIAIIFVAIVVLKKVFRLLFGKREPKPKKEKKNRKKNKNGEPEAVMASLTAAETEKAPADETPTEK